MFNKCKSKRINNLTNIKNSIINNNTLNNIIKNNNRYSAITIHDIFNNKIL